MNKTLRKGKRIGDRDNSGKRQKEYPETKTRIVLDNGHSL